MVKHSTPPPLGSKSLLIVEDSPTQAELLRYFLVRQGYQVSVASNGNQALAHLDASAAKPSLIISDIIMPEMSGFELCRRIKANEATLNIPVILLTALSDAQDVLEGLSCGADNFITKPYSEEYLLAHIQQILANQKLRQNERVRVGLEVMFSGKRYFISADSQQMLSLLLSTYEAAVQRNNELVETKNKLIALNERLEERTAALSVEIAERDRLQQELRALSLQDELTGLHNRRGFMTLAEQYWYLALRSNQEFVLFYMDVDKLKVINDTLGHAEGDHALQAIAQRIKETFRSSDILARMGGDEFTILFTDCDLASARDAINRLKGKLQQTRGETSSPYKLSLSVGLAHFNPAHQAGILELLKEADADMYVQKMKTRGNES